MRKTITAAVCALAALGWSVAGAQETAPVRSITQISGDVYRFQNNAHFGVFMVTPEGIVVADPLNVGTAEWLKAELAQRFDVPVKYVLYSHHHWDHASGGAVFEDTATFVSHADAQTLLEPPAAGAPLEGGAADADANGDGKVQEAEATGFLAARFADYDADGDGALTAREIFVGQFKDVRVPDEGYTDQKTITLGGKTVELIEVGGTHASDMSFIGFPDDDVLFVVDVIQIDKLPFRTLPWFDKDEVWAQIDQALALDYGHIVPGHGSPGTNEDLIAHRQYYVDLIEGVATGIYQQKSLEEIQETLTLEKYKDWEAYDEWRAENIAGMYAYLTRDVAE